MKSGRKIILTASYGVSLLGIVEKIDRVIMTPRCRYHQQHDISHLLITPSATQIECYEINTLQKKHLKEMRYIFMCKSYPRNGIPIRS